MFKKTPPYVLIGWICCLLVVLLVGYFYQFHGRAIVSFWVGLMATLSFTTLLMFVLEVWKLVNDYQSGNLFPMRNATFFVVCFSVVALPILGIYGAVTGQSLEASTMLLIPVFLFMAVRNVFRVTIDGVALEAKTGFRAPIYVPLFDITKVEETDRGIHIHTAGGKDIRLFQAFFFPGSWEKLRERLKEMGKK